jgi:hypothetical protein
MDMGENQRVLECEWIERPLDHQMLQPNKFALFVDFALHTRVFFELGSFQFSLLFFFLSFLCFIFFIFFIPCMQKLYFWMKYDLSGLKNPSEQLEGAAKSADEPNSIDFILI